MQISALAIATSNRPIAGLCVYGLKFIEKSIHIAHVIAIPAYKNIRIANMVAILTLHCRAARPANAAAAHLLKGNIVNNCIN